MRKTSVYLPDHLKRALTAAAAAAGCSEAELIRSAVEGVVTGRLEPGAAAGGGVAAPRPGHLVGVGVGPGAPDLLTIRAAGALRRADRVLAPATAPDAVGRAEGIVRQALPSLRITRLPFAMAPNRRARDRSVRAAAEATAAYLDAGEEVAFITLGDPLTYSTFTAVADAVRARRPRTTVECVPGIMAFQELASRTGTTIVDESQRLCVRTALDDGSDLAAELADPATTVVVYKGGRRFPELAAATRSAGRDGRAVAGELLGLPGERIGSLAELADGPASYLATVIVPASEAGR